MQQENTGRPLAQRTCAPCSGSTPRLDASQIALLLPEVPGFELDDEGKSISRDFQFKNFHETMAFVNAAAFIAHREDHHPDLEVGYRHCRVIFRTHANGGLSENDFVSAAKVNALLSREER
ncbi:MAG TPA: 4a-hydroxytetrahydrobiopterin dehydratase [Polyangiaceae bacterium]|nr:4a-hydroxytetrahydrobiopterin dehydratase [Polyangiaceae bacterium]